MGIVETKYTDVTGGTASVEVATMNTLSKHMVDITYLDSNGDAVAEDALTGTMSIEGTLDWVKWSTFALGADLAKDVSIKTAALPQANALGMVNGIKVSVKGLPSTISKIKVTIGSYA